MIKREWSYLKYWDVNNLFGRAMSLKLAVNYFKWVENISKLNEDFIKGYNDESHEEYFLEVYVEYPERLHSLHNDLPVLPIKIENFENLGVNMHNKKNMLHTSDI